MPAVAIMTSAFVDGATLMATALGASGYAFAVIQHPISSADDAGLADRARDAIDQAARLLRPASGPGSALSRSPGS